jgi:hypothetical protein
LLDFGFSIFSPFLSCWNGVNAQQKSKDINPADLEVALLAIEVVGEVDVGDFKAFNDSTVEEEGSLSQIDGNAHVYRMRSLKHTILFIMRWWFLILDDFTIRLLPKVTQEARSLA